MKRYEVEVVDAIETRMMRNVFYRTVAIIGFAAAVVAWGCVLLVSAFLVVAFIVGLFL